MSGTRPKTAPGLGRRQKVLARLPTPEGDAEVSDERYNAGSVWINRALLRSNECMTYKLRKSETYSQQLASRLEVARQSQIQFEQQIIKLEKKQGLLIELKSTIAPRALKRRLARRQARAARRQIHQSRSKIGGNSSNAEMDRGASRSSLHSLTGLNGIVPPLKLDDTQRCEPRIVADILPPTLLKQKSLRHTASSQQLVKPHKWKKSDVSMAAARKLLRGCQDLVRCQRHTIFLLQSDGMLAFQVASNLPKVRIPSDKGIAG
jgi:hypothetical protein